MEESKTKRKVKKGTVLSNKMEKTVVVQVSRTYPHPRYGKVVTRNKKYYAHNELKPLEVGEEVTIEETRPLSKLKRWRVVA
ncbi:MAG: 30S ribosomal protein S17 [Parachlamydia sp.]|jgi:small subunit ribosomal protein S17|nr:MAG: 30S ribosomal protein S17 [Parachlamydia sp.]